MRLINALILGMVLSAGAVQAAEYKLKKVSVLGVMKHNVIFQSQNVKVVKGSNVVRGQLIIQWGTQVFEVVNGYYNCNAKKVCQISDYDRVATYELCTVKKTKVTCTNKISGGNSDVVSEDQRSDDRPDDRDDSDRGHRDGPDSYGDEFGNDLNAEADIL